MEKKDDKEIETKRYKYNLAPKVIFLIGLMALGASVFGYMESQFLNTYIRHVQRLTPIYVAVMVSSSAIMGLIFLFVFGIISDNTRSKYGRRRPYLLLGGVICGIAMIVFGFSPDYAWVYIIDVIIIGIASNAFYASQRVLIPDFVDLEYRGRVNAIIGYFTTIGFLLPTVLALVAEGIFGFPDPSESGGTFISQEGHIFLLTIGGITLLLCGIIGFLFIKEKKDASELPPKKKFMEELRITFNIQELKKHKEFLRLILAQTVFKSGVSAVASYAFIIIFSLGLGGLELGLVFGIAAPALFIAIWLLGKYTDKIGRKKTVISGILISSIGFFVIPFLTLGEINIILFSMAFALVIVGLLGINAPTDTWAQDLLPEGKKAQFLGIFNIVNTVSQVIGATSGALVSTALIGVVQNPDIWIFLVVPFYSLLSIPLFLRVKETLTEK